MIINKTKLGTDRLNDMIGVYIGPLSPPSLQDLCAAFIRTHAKRIASLGESAQKLRTEREEEEDEDDFDDEDSFVSMESECMSSDLDSNDNDNNSNNDEDEEDDDDDDDDSGKENEYKKQEMSHAASKRFNVPMVGSKMIERGTRLKGRKQSRLSLVMREKGGAGFSTWGNGKQKNSHRRSSSFAELPPFLIGMFNALR